MLGKCRRGLACRLAGGLAGRLAGGLAAGLAVAAGLTVAALLTACTPRPESLTVFAAASLQRAFEQLAPQFSAESGVQVQLNFGGSSGLVEQMKAGAPADVFASADERTMDQARDSQVLAPAAPAVFATNRLTIAIPKGNPAGVTGLASLSNPQVAVAVCAPQVPCGAATAQVFERAQVSVRAVTEESNVTAVLTKVAAGQVDAGLVYVTDAMSSDAVEAIDFPESGEVVNSYPIAVTHHAEEDGVAAQAQAFVDYVRGDAGRAVLSSTGFELP